MPIYAYVIVIAGIAAWFIPFVIAHRGVDAASTVDKRSRWGVLLQFAAFTLLWQGHFWTRSVAPWRVVSCVLFFAMAAWLSWTSSRALAGQLRVDAALGADHYLVCSGPYSLVRNPIYTSMLLVLCAIGIVITGWQLFVAALVLFIVGTEIRVRTEEKLLAARFGDEFQKHRKTGPAYI